MTKLAHHVTLEIFSKAHDSIATAYRAIDRFAPVPMKELLETQWQWHPEKKRTKVYDLAKGKITYLESETQGEEGDITVLSYRFRRQRETQAFIEKIREAPIEQRQSIWKEIGRHIDAEGKLGLRLNLAALEKGLVSFAPGPCLFAKINLAAYPKNEETCVALAGQILGVNV